MNKSSEHIKTSKLLTEYYWQNNEATKGSHAHQQWAAHCMNPQTYQGEKTKAELEAIRYNIQTDIGITITVNTFLMISFSNTKIVEDMLNPIGAANYMTIKYEIN